MIEALSEDPGSDLAVLEVGSFKRIPLGPFEWVLGRRVEGS